MNIDEILNEATKNDIFEDVDVFKFDPDRVDVHDIVNSMKPLFTKMAFKNTVFEIERLKRKGYEYKEIEVQEIFDEQYDELMKDVSEKFSGLDSYSEKLKIKNLEKDFKYNI